MATNRTFKIFVQNQPNSVEVARYIESQIEAINNLGIHIKMVKVQPEDMDDEMIQTFRKLGITRFPAMLTNTGRAYIGVNQIIDVFKKGLTSKGKIERFGLTTGPTGGAHYDTHEYWMEQLYSGTDKRGNRIPRTDSDEPDDEGADIDARLRAYQRNMPRHRRQTHAPARSTTPSAGRRRSRAQEPDDDYDNIAGSDDDGGAYDLPPVTPPTTGRSTRGGGDDLRGLSEAGMDQKMLDAWMQNNAGTSDY